MSLYKKDFSKITQEEKIEWDNLKKQEIVEGPNGLNGLVRKSLYREYPKAVRHFLSLFPNYFLDGVELQSEKVALDNKLSAFKDLLDKTTTTERDVLNFIKEQQAHFIIGAILKNRFTFGHHACYIFPEFPFSPNFQIDYLIVGQNSDGYHFVFVELENPYGAITTKDGSFGDTIRKGVKQVEDWEIWLEENFGHLRLIFEKHLNENESLPREFLVFDKTRTHYVVVAGRRSYFTDRTYRLRRNNVEQRKLHVLHYDNLIEESQSAIGTHTY
jgi:hypothetical protein